MNEKFQLYSCMAPAISHRKMVASHAWYLCLHSGLIGNNVLHYSTHTGIISSWYDFAVLLVVFGHKGRWIGWGGVIMALGSLVCALPHWLISPYQPEHSTNNASDFGQCTLRYFIA
ncbi:unnamed protein product [Haemonchus placei]|uniref:MFS_1_like domain-containing protein n=1 Tax=Haemonchus placei TaxID=6290 RepID=A0A0N4WL11_HAEPC|nr:unnamed protein product [Haemonchus placei]